MIIFTQVEGMIYIRISPQTECPIMSIYYIFTKIYAYEIKFVDIMPNQSLVFTS